MKLLSLLLSDAADERLIPVNPIRARHRGRRRSDRRVERLWATPSQVLAVADNIARLPTAGTGAELLIVTAAWTGARWGELAALQRRNTHLEDGVIVIDPLIGAMIESQSWDRARAAQDRGVRPHDHPAPVPDPPPAEPSQPPRPSARVHLPSRGTAPASNFGRRALRPATEGTGYLVAPPVRLEPAKPGLTFHGLRHSHKTWMIADGVPEVAQSRRLGHILGDRIQETYSHVAAEVEHRLLEALNDRWDKAVADSPDQPAWRS
jgi:integrase